MNRDEIRAAILGSDDLPREPADVPWDLGGEKIYVRSLSADEKDAYVARTMPTGEFRWTEHLTAALLVTVIVTEDGDRVFADNDVAALGRKDAGTLSRLFKQAMRLASMDEESVKELEQGLGIAQSDASDTG